MNNEKLYWAHDKRTKKETLSEFISSDQFNDIDRYLIKAIFDQMLTAISEPKTFYAWLSIALADKKEVRHYLKQVYSTGEKVVASNGRIIHWKEMSLPKGYYDVPKYRMIKEDEEQHPGVQYPDIEGCINRLLKSVEPVISFNFKSSTSNIPIITFISENYEVNCSYDLVRKSFYGPELYINDKCLTGNCMLGGKAITTSIGVFPLALYGQ